MGYRSGKYRRPSSPAEDVKPALPLMSGDLLAQLDDAIDDLRTDLDYAFAQFSDRLAAMRGGVSASSPSTKPSVTPSAKSPSNGAAESTAVVPAAKEIEGREKSRASVVEDGALSSAARRVLEVLVAWDKPASSTLLSIFTGYSLMSGGFAGALAELKHKQLVYTPFRATFTLSESGSLAVGHVPDLPRGPALVAQTMKRFDPCSAAIVDFLYLNYPSTYALKKLAESTRSPAGKPYSSTSGGFSGSLGKLRKQGILRDAHGQPIGLSDEFILAAGLDPR